MAALNGFYTAGQHLLQSTRHSCLASKFRCSHVLRRNSSAFTLKEAVIITKMTRYEYEKQVCKGDECKLQKMLANKGSDYQGLLARHHLHHQRLQQAVDALKKHGVQVSVLRRHEYSASALDQADAVFSAGGDGTYLLAASKILDSNIPLIGINTDPNRSEGHLCLSKELSTNFKVAVSKLLSGQFRWRNRHRLRVTMSGNHSNDGPIELHDQQLCVENRFLEHIQEQEPHVSVEEERGVDSMAQCPPQRLLPTRALNEVFIGESNSARVSYYELRVNEDDWNKQKSSGITVSTGTGSTSWSLNINQLTEHDARLILTSAYELGSQGLSDISPELVSNVTRMFNSNLHFSPEDPRMAYTIRDPIINAIFNVHQPRGFASKIEIRSRMWDGCVVIDGGQSFPFNDGAVVTIEILAEDALKTVAVQ